jgi:hypothetical protein
MIDINKKYTTRDGREVRIYATDGEGRYPIHGSIFEHNIWCVSTWTEHGEQEGRHKSERDLVEAWQPQDKELVWCWDNDEMTQRTLRFFDAKNSCSFNVIGRRNGVRWDNYAKVEHVEQWMLDIQAKLDD